MGQTAPALTLPGSFALDETFFTQDIRLSRAFPLGDDGMRLLLFAEVFNLYVECDYGEAGFLRGTSAS